MRKTSRRVLLVIVLLLGSTALAMAMFKNAVSEVLFADQFEDY
jgi:hypothetical protein